MDSSGHTGGGALQAGGAGTQWQELRAEPRGSLPDYRGGKEGTPETGPSHSPREPELWEEGLTGPTAAAGCVQGQGRPALPPPHPQEAGQPQLCPQGAPCHRSSGQAGGALAPLCRARPARAAWDRPGLCCETLVKQRRAKGCFSEASCPPSKPKDWCQHGHGRASHWLPRAELTMHRLCRRRGAVG